MNAALELSLLVVALLFAGVLLGLTSICERRLDGPAAIPITVPIDDRLPVA